MYIAVSLGENLLTIFSTAPSITKTGSHSWVNKERYNVKGFVEAIHLWALIAVPVFSDKFAQKIQGSEKLFPSCLKWEKTRQPRLAEIDTLAKKEGIEIQTIVGTKDVKAVNVSNAYPEDSDFLDVIGFVMQGYIMTKEDWIREYVCLADICEGLANVHNSQANPKENCYEHKKLDYIISLLESLERRVSVVETILGITYVTKNTETKNKRDDNQEEEKQEEEVVE